MRKFTGKTGDVIRIRRDHDHDEGMPWIDFDPRDIDLYCDEESRTYARYSAAFGWGAGFGWSNSTDRHRGRIAKVIKRTPCYVYARVSK